MAPRSSGFWSYPPGKGFFWVLLPILPLLDTGLYTPPSSVSFGRTGSFGGSGS